MSLPVVRTQAQLRLGSLHGGFSRATRQQNMDLVNFYRYDQTTEHHVLLSGHRGKSIVNFTINFPRGPRESIVSFTVKFPRETRYYRSKFRGAKSDRVIPRRASARPNIARRPTSPVYSDSPRSLGSKSPIKKLPVILTGRPVDRPVARRATGQNHR